ncbi:hypothetical protein H4S03_000822 [Coemansia sp. S3946]|nr:hypothetical protein H4S03_000822 [Coemansia sp. S3946]
MENPFRMHSTMVRQPDLASDFNGALYRHPKPLNSLFDLTPERMRMLNSRNNYRRLGPHRTINTYGAANSIDRYSSVTAGFGSSENAMSTWRSPQPVGLGEVSGARATSSFANSAVTNASSANTTSKADKPLAYVKSAVVHMSATEINTQPVGVNNPVTSASSTSIAAKVNAQPVNAKSRHFVIPAMQAKRKCDGVDCVYKKRGVGLNGDNFRTAANVIRLPPPPRAFGLIRARPRPKGQAPTLATRRAHRRSPHVPGSGYRSAPSLSPEHVAVLHAMRFSSTVVGLHPAGQGEIEDGIAHTVQQQQMPDTFDVDIEAPGQDIIIDNGPVVFDGIHAPAPQPVNSTFGMDVVATEHRAVAELYHAGQGATEEHTPAPPVNLTAYCLPSKTRAPSTGVKRARQTPSFIARRLQRVVVFKQRNPADRSNIRRIAVPIRTRQSLKGRYRFLATRHDLGRLGLGFRDNGVSIRQQFTNSAGVVRLGSGMTLRDNWLRRRRRTSSVNEIHARQRQRARKEMRASQRLRKYPATTPDINVTPVTPPAIPNGGGATGWLPVGWSNFGQGSQTDVTTPAHVQLATTPAPPTLPGPTQTITPSDPTQATFMTATPTLPTEFAPTGFAQTIITPAAPTGFAPTTTATVSPASNAPTQAGLTLPPPTSTGPAPPATTFTFASTSGPSRTQPQTNISAHSGGGSRGRQSGRLSNRTGKGGTNQKAKPAEPREDANVSGLSADKSKYTEEHEIIEEYYPKILKRREDIGTTVATPHTLAIDRMYVVLLYIAVKERTSTKDGAILKMQLYALFGLSDRAIYDKYQKMVKKDPSKAIEGVDESTFE